MVFPNGKKNRFILGENKEIFPFGIVFGCCSPLNHFPMSALVGAYTLDEAFLLQPFKGKLTDASL
ncbi:MAG: hypothetical protein IJ177_11895 [Fibrobacter sp.]|uniref:hypothetical protein n=1 Tax=Fibrobacter sp. TaxID=35828 RepID=UPI0025C5B7C5|nr:hypothetical protein [Fibrobacter sp.]MBQ9226863.1 hypothetical protein [Fibrobacter sp.]